MNAHRRRENLAVFYRPERLPGLAGDPPVQQRFGAAENHENHIRVPGHDLLHRNVDVPAGIPFHRQIPGDVVHAGHFQVGVAVGMRAAHLQLPAVAFFEIQRPDVLRADGCGIGADLLQGLFPGVFEFVRARQAERVGEGIFPIHLGDHRLVLCLPAGIQIDGHHARPFQPIVLAFAVVINNVGP